MQELLAQSAFDKLKEGSIVPGTITEIRQNEVVVDIGGKAEGVIPASEFGDLGELQIGSQIEVILEKLEDRDGNPIISYDLAQQKKNWDNILQKCSEGSVVSGRVKAKVKGGLIVSIGVDSFLPASHIDIQPPKNLDQYIGQTYDFKVLKINLDRKNIVLSRRELIEEQRHNKRRDLLERMRASDLSRRLTGGQVELDHVTGVSGVQVVEVGAGVQSGGIDGSLVAAQEAPLEPVVLDLGQVAHEAQERQLRGRRGATLQLLVGEVLALEKQDRTAVVDH